MYDILSQSTLFKGLTPKAIEDLFADASYSKTKYLKGDIIAKRDEVYSGLLILLDGTVLGQVTDFSGNIVDIEELPAPNLIAPSFLFGGYNRLPVNVTAVTDAEIMVLHRGSLFEMMQKDMIVLSNFIDIISNRSNYYAKKIYFLEFKSQTGKNRG